MWIDVALFVLLASTAYKLRLADRELQIVKRRLDVHRAEIESLSDMMSEHFEHHHDKFGCCEPRETP